MAYIRVKPQSLSAAVVVVLRRRKIFRLLRSAVGEEWKVPETDIIPRICFGDVGFGDSVCRRLKTAPDVVVTVDTSDPDLVDRLGEKLKGKIEKSWKDVFGDFLKAEIWIDKFAVWGVTYNLEAPDSEC